MTTTPARAQRALFRHALSLGLLGLLATQARAEDAAPVSLQEALGDPDNLEVKGSVRARYEAIDNQFRPGLDKSSDALLLRTDIEATYHAGPVRIGAEVTDSRAYGAGSGSSLSTTEVNALALTQAYVGFDFADALGAGSRTSLQAGRFTMNMGSRRLVARNHYRNTINAFSGFRGDWKGAGGQVISAFYTMPVHRLPDDQESIFDNEIHADSQSFDLTFWGGFASTPLGLGGARGEAYFYALDEEDTPETATKNRHLRTAGGRVFRDPVPGSLDFELEGAYQFGNIRASKADSASQLDVSAYFVHAELGYGLATAWKPRLALELDLVSGDKGGGSYNRFDTLYGARRFEFGPTSLYGALGRNNIRSIGVLLDTKPSSRVGLQAMYRANWADSTDDAFSSTKVTDASGLAGRFAAHQIEARASYWLVPKLLQVEAGGAILINGDFLEQASGANGYGDTRYGYLSATLNL